ncbi:MAG TPA: hypothetical protein VHC94_19130 [Nitrobacter sp.]|nr:hypothetical protein [Nitrobacter sp.]
MTDSPVKGDRAVAAACEALGVDNLDDIRFSKPPGIGEGLSGDVKAALRTLIREIVIEVLDERAKGTP